MTKEEATKILARMLETDANDTFLAQSERSAIIYALQDMNGAEKKAPTIAEESEEEKADRLEKTLKPCPFCGGSAHIMRMGYPHYIYCENCGAKIHGREMGPKAEERSVNEWNSRWSLAPEITEELTNEMKWIVKETVEAERRILELARVIGEAIHTAIKSKEFSEAIKKITEQELDKRQREDKECTKSK